MGKLTIMVVDDSSPMREVIIKTVKAAGYSSENFLQASNGREALVMMQDNWIDLLVTDYNMPDMDGLMLIEEMKKDDVFASVPVLIITTERRDELIELFMEKGAAGYLKKPFKPEEIRQKIVEILGERICDESEAEDFDEGLDF
ncbi:MAG: response regulator [Desulfobacteraceae bacterium]|jgi:two-component system chemotaxis response regulator CheY